MSRISSTPSKKQLPNEYDNHTGYTRPIDRTGQGVAAEADEEDNHAAPARETVQQICTLMKKYQHLDCDSNFNFCYLVADDFMNSEYYEEGRQLDYERLKREWIDTDRYEKYNEEFRKGW